jgi:membrane protein involved in colicin uptake
MAVTIDIPGIGNVEAKNAASESTLREILKAMQAVQKNTASKGAKGGKDSKDSEEPKDTVSTPMAELGKKFGAASKVVGGFTAVLDSVTGVLGGFANVGDSLESAAQQIPLFGKSLGIVAAAAVKTNDALLAASKSGAGFGGSIQQFSAAASAAGMTMDKFGSLIARNGEGMLGFGATTEDGAKRFSQVSKALRTTSGDLYALGFSTEDINQGLASYGSLMRTQGLQGKQSNEQMVNGAKTYLKELDAMAKITGEERSVKESQMKALAMDAQFQASMAGKSAEARQSFLTTVGKIPGPLQGFVKDFLATGSLTTEETQRIGAMMGGDVMRELQSMRNKMQSGATLSAEEQDRLAIIMKRAAEQQLKNAGTSLAGATEMHGATAAVASALQINEGAVKKSAEEQRAAALESSGFNKKMQESQQRLAEFSNGFQIALANSGMIDFLMDAFSTMATLVQTFVVPAFQIIGEVLPAVGTALVVYLGLLLAQNATLIIKSALDKIDIALKALSNAPMLLFALAIGGLVVLFKKLGGDMQVLKDGVKILGSYFTEFGQRLTLIYYKIMDKITAGDKYKKLADEQEKLIEQTGKDREELKKGISDRMKNNRAANAHDAKTLAEKKQIDAEKNKLDYNSGPEALLKQFGLKENSKFAIDGKKVDVNKEKAAAEEQLAAAKTTAEKKAAINKIEEAEKKLADLDKLSKGEAVPKEKSRESLPKAEAAKKELEAKGEEKAAAEKKAAEEKAKAEEKVREENKKEGKGAAPAQESAETLLASLNTKMTELIKINKGTQAVSEQQLSVQKGMTSDLFAA